MVITIRTHWISLFFLHFMRKHLLGLLFCLVETASTNSGSASAFKLYKTKLSFILNNSNLLYKKARYNHIHFTSPHIKSPQSWRNDKLSLLTHIVRICRTDQFTICVVIINDYMVRLMSGKYTIHASVHIKAQCSDTISK